MVRRALGSAGLLLVVALAPPAGAADRVADYLPPVVTDDRVFPVDRTSWYSVINFKDEWRVPRMRFLDGKWRQTGVHEGTDIYAEPGTPIRSITAGRIENLGWTFYSGWRVGVRGDDGRYWFYAHLRRFAPGLHTGQRVGPGALLGEVGNTGYGEEEGHFDEFSHHLHVGIQERNGAWSNPYPLLESLYRAAVR